MVSFCFVDSKQISVPAQNQIHVNSNLVIIFNPTIFLLCLRLCSKKKFYGAQCSESEKSSVPNI